MNCLYKVVRLSKMLPVDLTLRSSLIINCLYMEFRAGTANFYSNKGASKNVNIFTSVQTVS